MKTIVNRDLDLSFSTETQDLLAAIKAAGGKMGKTALKELLEGKREEANGFVVVDLEAAPVLVPVADAPIDQPLEQEEVIKKEPTAGDADKKPAFDDEALKAAEAEFLAKGGNVTTEKPKADEPAAPKKERAPKAKAVIKAHAQKGKLKPVRKGTKIANGLEALLEGCTQAELEAAEIGDDVVDFVNRRVTKRGYGVSLTDGVIKLILPEGVTTIAYSGS